MYYSVVMRLVQEREEAGKKMHGLKTSPRFGRPAEMARKKSATQEFPDIS